MNEMSEQSIESIGKVHLKNVCERRGSGKDNATMNIIARRTTVVTAFGLINNVISYFKDIQGCKNVSRYKSLWSLEHEEAMADTSWRTEKTRFVFVFFNFNFKLVCKIKQKNNIEFKIKNKTQQNKI